MQRRDFLKKMAGTAAVTVVGSCLMSCQKLNASGKSESGRPNIVIVLTDDQGYADLGCYGAEGFETPNIDGMAEEGMRFTDFHVTACVCSPSRAALLTGCYPERVGIPNVLAPQGIDWAADVWNTGLNKDEETLAELLKSRGYATACIGKWHLGHLPEFLPTRHGFDEYFGLPYSNDMSPDPNNNSKPAARQYPPLPLIEDTEVIETEPDQSQLTTRYTEKALDFVDRNKKQPFFLYLAHTMPHVPLYVSEKFKGKSEKGLYGDVIMEIDWSVGQVLSKLNELGLDEKTLVIFTSDNGPWLKFGNHAGSAKPLRAGKATTFDGGHREPCVMRWPGKIPEGEKCNELCASIDILPTVVKLTGAKMPVRHIDGKDIWPLISGRPGAKTPHKVFYHYRRNELQAVRSGKWKLVLPHTSTVVVDPGKDGEGGKTEYPHIKLSLYNLEKDISEQNNVAEKHPDVVKKLLKYAQKGREDLGDSLTNTEGKNVREPGRVVIHPSGQ